MSDFRRLSLPFLPPDYESSPHFLLIGLQYYSVSSPATPGTHTPQNARGDWLLLRGAARLWIKRGFLW